MVQGCPSPQQQPEKYSIELKSYFGSTGKEFWMEHKTVFDSLAPPALELLQAPASEALCGTNLFPQWLLTAAEEDNGNACFPENE